MNLVVAVFPDRIRAEAVSVAMEKEGDADARVSIFGKGYLSVEGLGQLDPKQKTRRRVLLMATWLMPFGFFAGLTFSLLVNLDTFAWAGPIGNHVVGGLLGALSGGMGAFFSAGGFTLVGDSQDAFSYRASLEEGKYLVVVRTPDATTTQATLILRQFQPENLRVYEAEGTV